MNSRIRKPAFLAVTVALATLAACATTPQNSALSDAHLAYDQAMADPDAARVDPTDLQQARQALQNGDAALQNRAPMTDVEHFAYLARQRTASALQAGMAARSEQALARERVQRDQIVIAARTREAEQQRADAAIATVDAVNARAQADVARAQADAARAQLAALQAQQTDRGMVLTMGDVLFDTGKATLKDGAMQTIDRLADFLQKNPNEKVRIEGYTDSVGSEEMNLALSRRRADTVRDALLDRRIDASRIDVAALGERYAVASNDNAAGRQRNRRIEVVFSDANGTFSSPRS